MFIELFVLKLYNYRVEINNNTTMGVEEKIMKYQNNLIKIMCKIN